MRNNKRVFLTLFFALVFLCPLFAQDVDPRVRAYDGVKKWKVKINASATMRTSKFDEAKGLDGCTNETKMYSLTQSNTEHSILAIQSVIEKYDPANVDLNWGKFISGSAEFSENVVSRSDSSSGTYIHIQKDMVGSSDASGVSLSIQNDGTYSFTFPYEGLSSEGGVIIKANQEVFYRDAGWTCTGRTLEDDSPPPYKEKMYLTALSFFIGKLTEPKAIYGTYFTRFELPGGGAPIVGFASDSFQIPTNDGSSMIVDGKVDWEFVPDEPEDVELIVKAALTKEEYENWIPQGPSFDEPGKPGNEIIIEAYLQQPGGGPAPLQADKIIFELLDTSREPGHCLNWPPRPAADDTFDIRMDAYQNTHLHVMQTTDSQRAETKDGPVSSSSVTLSSYDWGGHTKVKVTAELPGGRRPVTGFLEWDKSVTDIPIPKSARNSRIADRWKKDNSIPGGAGDKDDDENDPVGDGHRGDGLTLYEEYRGFATQSGTGAVSLKQRLTVDPKMKDYFVATRIDHAEIYGAINEFEKVTELKVHCLKPDDLSPQHEINFNSSPSARNHLQHGIIIEKHPNPEPCAQGVSGVKGVIGTPGKSLGVWLGPNRVTDLGTPGSQTLWTVMHEMGHTCSMWHHGDTDRTNGAWVLWTPLPNASGIFEQQLNPDCSFTDQGKITIYDIGSTTPVHPARFSMPTRIYVGEIGGEHSGDVNCVMRYNYAGAALLDQSDFSVETMLSGTFKPDPPGRVPGVFPLQTFYPDTPYGSILCVTSVGNSIFGDAAPGRGDCKHQLCVNDKYKDDPSHDRSGITP